MSFEDVNEDFEYCGDCCVCDEPVDETGSGVCGECGSVFHWTACGGWAGAKHRCDNCGGDEDDDD